MQVSGMSISRFILRVCGVLVGVGLGYVSLALLNGAASKECAPEIGTDGCPTNFDVAFRVSLLIAMVIFAFGLLAFAMRWVDRMLDRRR